MNTDNPMRVVVCAANRYGNDWTEFVFIGIRHFCPVMRRNMEGKDIPWMRSKFGEEQGFVDQYGVFMSRTEAWKVANLAGQIRRRCGGDTKDGGTLYSENLY